MARDRELPPPLEMMCLNALWELGEGNVEDVRRTISATLPLAYTTVLTLLDRLSRRGAVARRKEGRGFRYRAVAERAKLRRMALSQFLEQHFSNSVASLSEFLDSAATVTPAAADPASAPAISGESDRAMAVPAGPSES